jgi:glycosyltransferase involved in cell wall biosynthesis
MMARSTIFHEYYGGMEYVAHELAEELGQLGNKVTLMTTALKKGQKECVILKKNGYDIISIPNTKPMSYSKSWWKYSVIYFEELNKKNPVDLVFSVSAAANALVLFKEKYRIPFVFQAHGTSIGEIKSKLRLNLKKKLSSIKNVYAYFKDLYYIPKYDLVITIGEKVYNDYLNSKIPLNKNVVLINNAVNLNLFHPSDQLRLEGRKQLGIPKDAHVFISTSRLHAEKGIKESINIFYEVQKDLNAYYLIIGEGPEKGNLQQQIEKLGLNKKVLLIGEVERKQLVKFYNVADYMLFSTLRQEGLPLTILEALATKVVCFVSNNIKINKNLPIVSINPSDISSSAQIIKKYILSEEIHSLKDNGFNIIQQEFSMTEWGNKYFNTLLNLIKK